MYYLTFDGEHRMPICDNLSIATDVFEDAVENNDWCPALVDDEGVILAAWSNDSDWGEWTVLIGPKEDPNPEPGIDRIWEEHNYKFGSSRM